MRTSLIFAAFTGLILSACSSGQSLFQSLDSRKNAGPCPTAGALYEAARVVKFDEDASSNVVGYSDITYTAEITGARLFCRYIDDDPLLAEIEIDFAFGQGPAAQSRTHQYEYFVAVMRRNSRILAKEYFTVDADFRNGRIDATTELVNRIYIPRVDDTISGANFEILVGFVLTEDQEEFNKQGQRFRLDAGNE